MSHSDLALRYCGAGATPRRPSRRDSRAWRRPSRRSSRPCRRPSRRSCRPSRRPSRRSWPAVCASAPDVVSSVPEIAAAARPSPKTEKALRRVIFSISVGMSTLPAPFSRGTQTANNGPPRHKPMAHYNTTKFSKAGGKFMLALLRHQCVGCKIAWHGRPAWATTRCDFAHAVGSATRCCTPYIHFMPQ
jgi:hypothetical protein